MSFFFCPECDSSRLIKKVEIEKEHIKCEDCGYQNSDYFSKKLAEEDLIWYQNIEFEKLAPKLKTSFQEVEDDFTDCYEKIIEVENREDMEFNYQMDWKPLLRNKKNKNHIQFLYCLCKQALTYDPNNYWIYYKLGQYDINMETFDRASRNLEQALTLTKNDKQKVNIYYELGRLRYLSGSLFDLDEIESNFQEAIYRGKTTNTFIHFAYLYLILAYLEAERFTEAKTLYGEFGSRYEKIDVKLETTMWSYLTKIAEFGLDFSPFRIIHQQIRDKIVDTLTDNLFEATRYNVVFGILNGLWILHRKDRTIITKHEKFEPILMDIIKNKIHNEEQLKFIIQQGLLKMSDLSEKGIIDFLEDIKEKLGN
ncbi:MAG: tetratricopeptide repeat protein [Candidatus Kariarchaeaceae archaeon]